MGSAIPGRAANPWNLSPKPLLFQILTNKPLDFQGSPSKIPSSIRPYQIHHFLCIFTLLCFILVYIVVWCLTCMTLVTIVRHSTRRIRRRGYRQWPRGPGLRGKTRGRAWRQVLSTPWSCWSQVLQILKLTNLEPAIACYFGKQSYFHPISCTQYCLSHTLSFVKP